MNLALTTLFVFIIGIIYFRGVPKYPEPIQTQDEAYKLIEKQFFNLDFRIPKMKKYCLIILTNSQGNLTNTLSSLLKVTPFRTFQKSTNVFLYNTELISSTHAELKQYKDFFVVKKYNDPFFFSHLSQFEKNILDYSFALESCYTWGHQTILLTDKIQVDSDLFKEIESINIDPMEWITIQLNYTQNAFGKKDLSFLILLSLSCSFFVTFIYVVAAMMFKYYFPLTKRFLIFVWFGFVFLVIFWIVGKPNLLPNPLLKPIDNVDDMSFMMVSRNVVPSLSNFLKRNYVKKLTKDFKFLESNIHTLFNKFSEENHIQKYYYSKPLNKF